MTTTVPLSVLVEANQAMRTTLALDRARAFTLPPETYTQMFTAQAALAAVLEPLTAQVSASVEGVAHG